MTTIPITRSRSSLVSTTHPFLHMSCCSHASAIRRHKDSTSSVQHVIGTPFHFLSSPFADSSLFVDSLNFSNYSALASSSRFVDSKASTCSSYSSDPSACTTSSPFTIALAASCSPSAGSSASAGTLTPSSSNPLYTAINIIATIFAVHNGSDNFRDKI